MMDGRRIGWDLVPLMGDRPVWAGCLPIRGGSSVKTRSGRAPGQDQADSDGMWAGVSGTTSLMK